MKKEIGGYFEIEEAIGKEYYDFLRFNSSRSSLHFIIKNRKIKKIYLPYYLCNVVENTLLKENVNIIYYHIDDNFLPLIEEYDNISYIYLVNFFDLLSSKEIKEFAKKYNNKIILDNTHSFFNKPILDIDTIYNCRKYFGVPDGSYLFTNLVDKKQYEEASSLCRIKHIFGRYELSAQEYYDDYILSEESIESDKILRMSKITENMLKNINYNNIKKIRNNNFTYLHNLLKEKNLLKLRNKSLFMYPLLVKNGKKLKRELIKEHIFVPTLWPELNDKPLNIFEKNLLDNLVLLPIDQRYSIDDMEYIYNKINEIERK